MRRLSAALLQARLARHLAQHLVHALLLLAAVVLALALGAAAAVEAPPPAAPGPVPAVPPAVARGVEQLVARWAPLVWLSPGERFMPAGVEDFLQHVTPRAMSKAGGGSGGLRGLQAGLQQGRRGRSTPAPAAASATSIPQGPRSAAWYLVSNASVEALLGNSSSFLYGRDPSRGPVPVYAVVTLCTDAAARLADGDEDRVDGDPSLVNDLSAGGAARPQPPPPQPPPPLLHVTYWMFFPYNEGKPVCVLDLGPLGPWPLPLLWGTCVGTWRRFGAHVGDWEHVSLMFSSESHPDAMYVSTHEAGAFYRWSVDGQGRGGGADGHLVLERQEVRQGSELLQRASFPPLARLHRATGRPELFAAQGSHGLWARPGAHRYVRVPRLYDHSGYGVPWRTWERLAVLYEGSPSAAGWLRFLGRWGNPRAGCHPLSAAICTQADGPTGIPLKGRPFSCPAPAPAPPPRRPARRLPPTPTPTKVPRPHPRR